MPYVQAKQLQAVHYCESWCKEGTIRFIDWNVREIHEMQEHCFIILTVWIVSKCDRDLGGGTPPLEATKENEEKGPPHPNKFL